MPEQAKKYDSSNLQEAKMGKGLRRRGMNDYVSRATVDKAVMRKYYDGDCRTSETMWQLHLEIQREPAADVVEVVRRRECKHFRLDAWRTVNGVPLIVAHEICDLWAGGCKTNPDGYCAWGEQKDGSDDETDL